MSFEAEFLQDGFMGNLTMLRALQCRCRMTDKQAAAFCLVSIDTYRR